MEKGIRQQYTFMLKYIYGFQSPLSSHDDGNTGKPGEYLQTFPIKCNKLWDTELLELNGKSTNSLSKLKGVLQ